MKKNTKLKPLSPTLREKKRYVGFEIIAQEKIQKHDFEDAFKKKLESFIGTFGYAKSGAFLVREKYDNNKGVIRVNNNYTDVIKAIFTMIKKIGDTDVIVRSIRTSGMINKAFSR